MMDDGQSQRTNKSVVSNTMLPLVNMQLLDGDTRWGRRRREVRGREEEGRGREEEGRGREGEGRGREEGRGRARDGTMDLLRTHTRAHR